MRWLLDANVLSEVEKPRPDARVSSWLLQHEAAAAVSELTTGELTKGVFTRPAGPARERLAAWIHGIERELGERLLPVTLEVFKRWSRLCGEMEARGRRLPVMDSLLAATALVHDLTLVTRNTEDFPAEVPTLNPWRR